MQIAQNMKLLHKYQRIFLLFPFLLLILLFFLNYKSPNNYTDKIAYSITDVLKKNGIQSHNGTSPMVTGTHYIRGKIIITITEYEKIPPITLIEIIKLVEQYQKKETRSDQIEIALFKFKREEINNFYRWRSIIEEITPTVTILINRDEN